jgi:phage gp16-like protein
MAECVASKCSRKLVAKHEADIAVEIINIFKLVHEDGKLNNGKGGALYKQADKCMKVMAERCMGVSHATNMHAMVYDIMYKYHRVSEIVENQIMADLTLSD